jgi:V-type H+-transporting ATPase subunit a
LHNHNGTAEGEDVEVAGVPQTENHEGGDEPHEFSDVMIHQVEPFSIYSENK